MNGIHGSILRVLVTGAITAGLAISSLGPSAQAVPTIRPTIWVVPAVGPPGGLATVNGLGFTCTGPVTLHIQYPKPLALWYLGKAKPEGAAGSFQALVRIPRDAQEGPSRIVALQGDCNATARFRVVFLP
jgi:hypothetical protein